jgi:hypothetical protein
LKMLLQVLKLAVARVCGLTGSCKAASFIELNIFNIQVQPCVGQDVLITSCHQSACKIS